MMTLTAPEIDQQTMALIRMAVGEDLGWNGFGKGKLPAGDRTVELAIPSELQGVANIVARRPGVISGTYLIAAILQEYGAGLLSDIAYWGMGPKWRRGMWWRAGKREGTGNFVGGAGAVEFFGAYVGCGDVDAALCRCGGGAVKNSGVAVSCRRFVIRGRRRRGFGGWINMR